MTSPILASLFILILTTLAHARVFTDNSGRQVEAELVGVRGEHVVISSNGKVGRWPIAKLSAPTPSAASPLNPLQPKPGDCSDGMG